MRYLLAVIFVCAPFVAKSVSFKQSVSNQEMLKHGKDVYMNRCIGCHGVKGDGKGPAATFLDPKPRDFTSGVFKFKTTPNESLPTDEDMMKVISQGVLGTSMPSFHLMPEVSRMAVVEYVKSFSTIWNNKENLLAKVQGAPFPKQDFSDHQQFIARAKKGRGHYVDNCATCHGRLGHGDGLGGEDLVDDWDNPIKPANLTKKYIKTGKSVRDIYRVLLSGIAGTPMPAFKDALTDDELWDVAAYVLYLRGLNNESYNKASPPIAEITKAEVGEE